MIFHVQMIDRNVKLRRSCYATFFIAPSPISTSSTLHLIRFNHQKSCLDCHDKDLDDERRPLNLEHRHKSVFSTL
jgi:hypothetical protein